MTYRLSRKAVEDIRNIHAYGTTQFGANQANKYHLALKAIFDLIGRNPYIARERSEISPPVRIHPFGTHLIIYTVDTGGVVLILRLRHGHEDWRNRA